MQVQEILDSVTRQFGDESGVQITTDDIFRWINQGQRQFVLQNESLLLTTTTTNAVANQQSYTLPTNLLTLRGIQYKQPNTTQYYRIRGYDLSKFNETVDGWDNTLAVGIPQIYTVIGNSITLFPIPQESLTAALKIYYNRTPVDVTGTFDVPELPTLYHEPLIKYCLMQAYEMDEDWEAAGNKVTDLDRDINILRGRESWRATEYHDSITVLEEDMW